jgi:hypothetical protein
MHVRDLAVVDLYAIQELRKCGDFRQKSRCYRTVMNEMRTIEPRWAVTEVVKELRWGRPVNVYYG